MGKIWIDQSKGGQAPDEFQITVQVGLSAFIARGFRVPLHQTNELKTGKCRQSIFWPLVLKLVSVSQEMALFLVFPPCARGA